MIHLNRINGFLKRVRRGQRSRQHDIFPSGRLMIHGHGPYRMGRPREATLRDRSRTVAGKCPPPHGRWVFFARRRRSGTWVGRARRKDTRMSSTPRRTSSRADAARLPLRPGRRQNSAPPPRPTRSLPCPPAPKSTACVMVPLGSVEQTSQSSSQAKTFACRPPRTCGAMAWVRNEILLEKESS
jgi:hypothetical protein